MFLGDWGNNESRVEVHEGLSQGSKLGVAPSDFQILHPVSIVNLVVSKSNAYPSAKSVDDEAPAAFMILPGIRDEDGHVGILIEDLLYPAIVYTLPDISRVRLLGVISLAVIVAEIIRLGNVVGRHVGRWTGGRAGLTSKDRL